MIGFANFKYIIYISLAGGVVLLLFLLFLFWKRKMLSIFLKKGAINASLIVGSVKLARIKSILIIISIIFTVLLLLRPQWGEKVREVNSEGSDVLIALDVSRSMMAKDVKPNRLSRAKNAIKWIAESLKGDRIGLILFAGDAFLQCPLTTDIGAFMMFLDSASPESIRLQGTDIGRTLVEAHRVFKKKRLTSKILVLITDGEDHEGAGFAAAEMFKKLGVSIYTVGIGRDKGELIPSDDSSGDIYQRDSEGKLIRSKKNIGLLKQIAGFTGGGYIDITNNLSGLKFILEIIKDQQKNEYDMRIIKEPKERYQAIAILLILLLTIELLIPERKRYKK